MGFKYDVFICHRALDIRENFLSHLKSALRRQGIRIYEEDDLERGSEAVPYQLLRAIEESRVLVVILSKNFAAQPWCLEQLEGILKDRDKYGQVVVPVFHNVDPWDVRELTGRFGGAFDQHELRYEEEKVQRWRVALTEIANIAGWNSTNTRPESELVERVVLDIENKLKSPKLSVEAALVVTNFILEIPSAVADQLSSVHKPLFALAALVMSVVSLVLIIAELIYRGRAQQRVNSVARFPCGFVDVVSFFCASGQLIVTAVNYSFINGHRDSPIKISVWPLVFAFGLLCSKFMGKPTGRRARRVAS